MDRLAERIKEKIAEIPVHGGSYMSLYPETLRNILSHSLLDKIAAVAAEVAAPAAPEAKE